MLLNATTALADTPAQLLLASPRTEAVADDRRPTAAFPTRVAPPYRDCAIRRREGTLAVSRICGTDCPTRWCATLITRECWALFDLNAESAIGPDGEA